MNDREVIALMTDTLKSVREAIVYTFPNAELSRELYKRVTLAYSVGLDKLKEENSNAPKPAPKQTRNSKKTVRSDFNGLSW